MDPHWFDSLDPDMNSQGHKNLDPDPRIHCRRLEDSYQGHPEKIFSLIMVISISRLYCQGLTKVGCSSSKIRGKYFRLFRIFVVVRFFSIFRRRKVK